jgi:septation ring formation regulator EzrA
MNLTHMNHIHAESMSAEMPVDAVHIAILLMLVTVVFTSLCMMIQYVNRYHKYQRASVRDDLADSESSGNGRYTYIRPYR